jgi:hypothetical protein
MVIRNNCYINSNIDSIQTIIKKDYNSLIYNLKKYEIENSIIDPHYLNLSCKWNILFISTQMEQLLNYINNNKGSSIFINYLKQFSKFFKNDLKQDENEQFYIPDMLVAIVALANYSCQYDGKYSATVNMLI